MATSLKTDYKDFIPPESGKKYIITTDASGFSTIQDATEYTQEGDTFGASDINNTNQAVNDLVQGSYLYQNTLYYPGDSPRSNQGNLNLTDSLNNYDLVIVVTSMKTNAYVNTYCNVFVPAIFKTTSVTMIAGYTADGSVRGEQFQFMRKDGQPDYSGDYCYLPETLESFGIKIIYGLRFGINESSEEVSA